MRNDIPSDSASNFGARVREALMTYLGKQGDPLDRGVTLRDLVDAGFASLSNFKFGGNSAPLLPGSALANLYEPDLTPPPTPTGFVATASITTVIVECDDPTYLQGHGHLRSRLYGATRAAGAAQPVFAAAVDIHQFTGAVSSYSTNPATEWHLWLKWETVDGVLSVSPAGGVNGVVVTTGQDVSLLLTALTGKLRAEQLYSSLGARIDLIDAPSATVGSVNARLAVIQSQVNDLQNTPEYSNTESYSAGELVSYSGSIYQATQTTLGNLPTNTAYWTKVGEYSSLGAAVAAHTTQIASTATALTAETTARNTLSAQVNNATTGLPATRATLINDYYTKTAADSAISSAVSTLVSTTALNTALGAYTTSAVLDNNFYTKTATDGAISAAVSTLVSTTALNTALGAYTTSAVLNNNFYTKTATDGAISAAVSTLVSTTALNTALGAYTTSAVLNNNFYTKTATDGAISAAVSTLVSTTALNTALGAYTTSAVLNNNFYTKTATDGAISSATSTLVSTSALNTALGAYTTTAALAIEYYTKASGLSLEGKYSVKIDLNGYVSGFGLASTANTAAPSSTFAVRADSFYIASPAGPGVAPTMPFIVRTTATTINGVEVPVGVYVTDAFIQNGTITNVKIANAAIDNAKIANMSADKIRAGSVSVGEYIQSANYVANTSGWRISGAGVAEFGAASIRGQLAAAQIDTRGLSIKDTAGNIILTAGASVVDSAFAGNVIGTLAGTAAATVVSTANIASSTATAAAATAATAYATAGDAAVAAANAASIAAGAAASAASAASTAAAAATAATAAQATADAKLSKSGAQVLTGPITLNAASAITVGTPALDGVAGHNGFYIGSTGIVGTKNGVTTFSLDNAGNASFKGDLTGASGTFGGTLSVGSAPAISGTTMTGFGAYVNGTTGAFALGNSATNITFSGTTGAMQLNGNVVGIENLIPGAALPNYVRTYKGSVTPALILNGWLPLAMDAAALNNKLGAVDYDAYRTWFPAGTYFYELSVPVKNNTSDTNDATYTAIVENPPGTSPGTWVDQGYFANDPKFGSGWVSNMVWVPYNFTVIDNAGANVVGDWQTATIFGVGRFTLTTGKYLSPAVKTTEGNAMNIVARSGFCTLIWRVWRAN